MNVQCKSWWVSDSNEGHMGIRNLINEETLMMPSDQIRPVLMLDDKFECIVPEREEWLGESRTYPPKMGPCAIQMDSEA